MNKAALRRKLISKRDFLSEQERQSAARQITKTLLESAEYKNAETIFIYYSVNSEVDTQQIIARALADRKKVALPAVLSKTEMGAYLIENTSSLQSDHFGIPTPEIKETNYVNPQTINLAIVPLLAYNRQGYRIGYGRGYYDRYLARLNPHCVKIGVAYKEQRQEDIPVFLYDYPLDKILTQSGYEKLTPRVETHCHSEFSIDCERSFDKLYEEATAKNYQFLTLTDHYDKDVIDGVVKEKISPVGSRPQENEWIMPLASYIDFCLQKKAELRASQDRPQLLIGLELGYQDYLVESYNALIKQYPLDCVIGSVHTMQRNDFAVFGEPLFSQGKKSAYRAYLSTLIEMIESGLDFDILAHFDYVTRYAPYPNPALYYRDFPDLFDRLFHLLIENQICLEVNSRIRYRQIAAGKEDPGLSDLAIYRRYYELGGRMICFATDSHESGSLQALISDSIEQMRKIGFTYGTYFINRKPEFYEL